MSLRGFASKLERAGRARGPTDRTRGKDRLLSRRLVRRIRHHLLLAAIALPLVALIAGSFSGRLIVRSSAASAYAALIFLAATLVLGPLNVLRLRPNPLSSDLRRDCGIWAAGLGVAHTALALWVPFQGAFWRAFTFAPARVRPDSLAFANDVGLAATLLLILLFSLSNDRSIRLLGRSRWKAAQRLTYLLFAFAVLHTVLYQLLVRSGPLYEALLALVLAAVVALQVEGFLERRARRIERGP